MEFEMSHLDIIQVDAEASRNSNKTLRPASELSAHSSQSLILNELQKDTEELQNKLKLNHRRLLLFETENNKLIEEKNKLFFEAQNLLENNQLLSEKNTELQNQFNAFQNQNDLLIEKNETYIKINQKQASELKRYAKFHFKIQNTVKPFLQKLKNTISELKTELSKSKDMNSDLQNHASDLAERFETERIFLSKKISTMELDKNQTITSYEEQIHSFSKEIVHLEQLKDEFAKEIARLKKAVEFKNYFENELIKFKRVHEDDQREILELKNSVNQLEMKIITSELTKSASFEKLKTTENQLLNSNQMLETTREQLVKNLDHANILTERFSRLEKLNLNLSQQMHPKT